MRSRRIRSRVLRPIAAAALAAATLIFAACAEKEEKIGRAHV